MSTKRFTKCENCTQPFSEANTHTKDGWLETQISGLCEDCFDEICAEAEDEAGDYGTDYEAPAF